MPDYDFELDKQPREERTIAIDFSQRAEFLRGEIIQGAPQVDVTYNDLPVSGIFVASSADGAKALVRIKDGEHGKNYKISVLVTTNQGHKREADGLLRVREK